MSNKRAQEFRDEGFGGGEEVSDDEEEFGEDEEESSEYEEKFGEEEEMEDAGEEELDEDEEFMVENEVKEGYEVGEEEESHSVEIDGEKKSVLSPNKRIKVISVDRLSALSNFLLIRILFCLDDTKEAAMTSVLSKRWKCLWMLLPKLRFRDNSEEIEKISKFVAWVNRTLLLYHTNYVVSFEVEFTYHEGFASDAYVWVAYAVNNGVREFNLLLNSSPNQDLYTLPQIMFYNPFVVWLQLRNCIMAPRSKIEWLSVCKLRLEDMELPQHVIENLLTGCPQLSDLFLISCWGFNRFEAKFQKLVSLTIVDSEDGNKDPFLEISSPLTERLLIVPYLRRRKWLLTNIPSVVRATIDFNIASDWDASSEEEMNNVKDLFQNLKHVKELEVECDGIQVLSMLAMNGWKLPRSKRRRCVKVNAECNEYNISGIICLLESSPNLETLVINSCAPSETLPSLGPAARGDLDCDLLHLRTVDITMWSDPNAEGGPMMRLAQILLKRCTVLEKMVCNVEYTHDFYSVIQTMLGYPRSSPNAVILIPD